MKDCLKKTQCIIFDFDGVLADTEKGRFNQLSKLLLQRGIRLGERCREKDLFGLSTSAFLRKFFPEMSEREIEEITYIRHSDYLNNLPSYCIPYPYTGETVKELQKRGYRLVLATANETQAIPVLLKHIGLNGEFSSVYGREIMEDSNGDKSYYFLSQKMEYPPASCVVIEDSLVGVKAAKKAGYFTIAMNRYGDTQIIQTADMAVNNLNELLNLF